MFKPARDWNPLQKDLKNKLNEKDFDNAIELSVSMLELLHSSYENSLQDRLLNDIDLKSIKYGIRGNNHSIAWNLWHITRIEDIATNMLIENNDQIYTPEVMTKLNISETSTGNAMTHKEIEKFNLNIDPKELLHYRELVGKRTISTLKKITFNDLKRKITEDQRKNILECRAITDRQESLELLDFWCKMNIMRVILMPITRHQAVHFNESFNIKKKLNN